MNLIYIDDVVDKTTLGFFTDIIKSLPDILAALCLHDFTAPLVLLSSDVRGSIIDNELRRVTLAGG